MPKYGAWKYYTPEGLSSGAAVWGEKVCACNMTAVSLS